MLNTKLVRVTAPGYISEVHVSVRSVVATAGYRLVQPYYVDNVLSVVQRWADGDGVVTIVPSPPVGSTEKVIKGPPNTALAYFVVYPTPALNATTGPDAGLDTKFVHTWQFTFRNISGGGTDTIVRVPPSSPPPMFVYVAPSNGSILSGMSVPLNSGAVNDPIYEVLGINDPNVHKVYDNLNGGYIGLNNIRWAAKLLCMTNDSAPVCGQIGDLYVRPPTPAPVPPPLTPSTGNRGMIIVLFFLVMLLIAILYGSVLVRRALLGAAPTLTPPSVGHYYV